MKNLTALLTLFILTIAGATAQDLDVPREGAKIYVLDNKGNLNSNETYTFDLQIVRSKRARKATFDAPRLSGSKDLTFVVEADVQNPDRYKVTVNATDVKAGKYIYTITSRSNGAHRISGTTTSFSVGASGPGVASAGGN